MKNLYLTILLSFFAFQLFAQSDTTGVRLHAIDIQKKYAPDKRSVYFHVQIKGDSVKLETSSKAAMEAFETGKPINSQLHFASSLLPNKQLGGFEFGVANLSVCNNRANPQNAAELMTQMLLGTPIKILKKQGGFYLVETPDGYLSWTDGGAIKPMNKTQFEAWQIAEKVIFTADYGHGFSTADVNSKRVSDLVSGNILLLLGKASEFYKVGYPDGRTAFVPKNQLSLYKNWVKRPNPDASAILTTAQTLIGVPYLWGGTSIKGVDCSGFTKTAYFLNGIIIPRDASQQALVGEEVDILKNDSVSLEKCLTNLKPGDLLFFSAAKKRGLNGGKITHTAIYMGNGEFIQSAGMVRVSSMSANAPNYDAAQLGTLVGARRILTAIGNPEITRIDKHEWYLSNGK